MKLNFDANGLLATVLDIASNITYPFRQEFFYYKGSRDLIQPSGAYIFRPEGGDPIAFNDSIQVNVSKVRANCDTPVRG